MEPRDLLKKLHPNQFSDSKIIDKIQCPRELFNFHLSKLSEPNKHFDFEDLESAVILKDDEPIIPSNIENPPINELLNLLKKQKIEY